VSWSRPGYGKSTAQRNRTVRSIAADAQLVVEALALEAFVVAGWSGGGPHALAIAALTKGCRGALVLAGVGPATVADLSFLDGMGEENIEEFSLAFEGGEEFEAFIEESATAMAQLTVADLVDALGTLAPPPDAEALRGPLGDVVVDSFRHGCQVSGAGWRDDDVAFVKPWGFELDAISVPVRIVQGGLDTMVPQAHGAWLVSHLRTATGRVLPEEGHISIWDHLDEEFSFLRDQFDIPS
jgi:pimeloyl-ACP methyl ester carboxylesterase